MRNRTHLYPAGVLKMKTAQAERADYLGEYH